MSITPFEAYNIYLALKQHFSSSYDVFKYNWKTRAKQDTFNKRNDRYFFEKLAKHPDPKSFLLANLLINNKAWIKDLAYGDKSKTNYEDWVKRTQSLKYNFKNELSLLDDSFDSNFKVYTGEHPKVLRLYLGGEISLETLIILISITECLPYFISKMLNDPIWQDIHFKINKYRPFINFNKDEYKKIVIDKFNG